MLSLIGLTDSTFRFTARANASQLDNASLPLFKQFVLELTGGGWILTGQYGLSRSYQWIAVEKGFRIAGGCHQIDLIKRVTRVIDGFAQLLDHRPPANLAISRES